MTREDAIDTARRHLASARSAWVIDTDGVRRGRYPRVYRASEDQYWLVPLTRPGYVGASNVLVVSPDSGRVEWVRSGE